MLKRLILPAVLFALAGLHAGHAQGGRKLHLPTLEPQKSGTTQLLIAVSPVNARVVWASGAGGTFTVTTNGGSTWKAGVVPGAEALQFRDVQGVSDQVAYLMSIGDNTGDFRIYKTEDAGAHWSMQFQNTTANAFYDCFAFWDRDHGIAHSDSVNGTFPDIRTLNGQTWNSIARNLPPALPGEASFSSSGTCIATQGRQNAWAVTGGSSIARVLATRDGGDTWHAYNTPLLSSASGGGFSVAFRDAKHGIVGGGDLSTNSAAQAATSGDGGRTWTLTAKPPVPGAIFGLAYVQGQELGQTANPGDQKAYDRTVVVTTESLPNFRAGAAAWTPDEGQNWFPILGASGYWAVAFANPQAGWLVGNNGQILKVSFPQ